MYRAGIERSCWLQYCRSQRAAETFHIDIMIDEVASEADKLGYGPLIRKTHANTAVAMIGRAVASASDAEMLVWW